MSWISTTEAATRLGVSEQQIRALCRAGALTAQRSGDKRGSWLVEESSVQTRSRTPRVHTRPASRPTEDLSFDALQIAHERSRADKAELEAVRLEGELRLERQRVESLERTLAERERTLAGLVEAHKGLLGAVHH